MMVTPIHFQGQRQLALVVRALDFSRPLFCRRQGREQQSGQNRNDRNDDQQLDQCEGRWRTEPHRIASSGRPGNSEITFHPVVGARIAPDAADRKWAFARTRPEFSPSIPPAGALGGRLTARSKAPFTVACRGNEGGFKQRKTGARTALSART